MNIGFDIEEDLEDGDLSSDGRVKRKRKEYRPAVARPKTMRESRADQDSLFDFDDIEDDFRPGLRELYGTVKDVHNVIGTNGLKAVSLFSGSGASQTGFALSGWRDVLSVEFVKSARETIASNYPANLIEPEKVSEYALEWMKEHDSKLPIVMTKRRKLSGVVYEPIIDWAATKEAYVAEFIQSDDETIVSEFDAMRYEVNKRLFTEAKVKADGGPLPIWGDDVRFLDMKAFMEVAGIQKGDIDCLEGSPPCKSFSMSGLRDAGWGEVFQYSGERNQRTDDLFFEYVRVLRELQPKTFIAENVSGLIAGEAASQMMEPLLEAFDEMGYRVDYRLVKANDYGVPQVRPRVFIIGIRKDLVDMRSGSYAYPKFPEPHTESYVLQDVFDAVGDENSKSELEFANIEGTEAHKTWGILSPGQAPANKQFQITRCHPRMPIPTVTAQDAANPASAGPLHPFEPRKFTITEYRYLFGFPTDYVFTGSLNQQGERMGRAVAPFLMKQLSGSIAEILLNSRYESDI